jgi:hypothetical protein
VAVHRRQHRALARESREHDGNGSALAPFAVAPSSGRYSTGNGVIATANTIQVSSSVSAPTQIQYAVSAAGNVFNHVAIPTEGGTKTVDRLPGSLFSMPLK